MPGRRPRQTPQDVMTALLRVTEVDTGPMARGPRRPWSGWPGLPWERKRGRKTWGVRPSTPQRCRAGPVVSQLDAWENTLLSTW